jgi:hypothetical protein
MKVADAMTPRSDVVIAELPGTRDDVLEHLQERGFSSVPVVKQTDEGEQYRGLVSREELIERPDEDQLAVLMREVPTVAADATIEAAARLGGDSIPHLVELAFGVSLAELMVRSHCGDSLADVEAHPMPRRLSAIRFFTRKDVSPRVGGPELESLRRSPGIHEVQLAARQGGATGPAVDFRGRIAHVVCTGASADVLDARLAHASAVLAGGLDVVAGEYERKCV